MLLEVGRKRRGGEKKEARGAPVGPNTREISFVNINKKKKEGKRDPVRPLLVSVLSPSGKERG